jgi:hypothetical protein
VPGCWVPALSPLSLVLFISGDYEGTCIYAFTDPFYPSFTLPFAQPNSPGDVQLNKNNPIRLTNKSSLASGQGCNSGIFSYYETSSDKFFSTYIDSTGQNSSIANIIYATNHDQLYSRTIQSNQANLGQYNYPQSSNDSHHKTFKSLLTDIVIVSTMSIKERLFSYCQYKKTYYCTHSN